MSQAKVLSVSELTQALRAVLEPQFRGVSVRGEISNCKLQTSGHLYFTLKDSGAQLSSVLFRNQVATLARLPKEGDQVILRGELNIYPPRGQYQLIARELQFAGVGELLLKLQQLKESLQARGWFDPKLKKTLPRLPKKIGVITSPTGAVIQDILQVLTRRFTGFQLILNPVKVQGDGAAQEIAQAILDMNRFGLADVLIVGRGGGSIEDLWAFNEEIVAKAIFESQIPIISAVGHETDVTIADWVADVRAPTPSAAAEMVILEKTQLIKTLEQAKSRIKNFLIQEVQQKAMKLRALVRHPLLSQPHSLLAQSYMRLDDIARSLDALRPSRQIESQKMRLQGYLKRLDEVMRGAVKRKYFSTPVLAQRFEIMVRRILENKKETFLRLQRALLSLHPDQLLKKGYALLFSEKDSSLILSSKELKEGELFHVLLADGRLSAEVRQVESKNGSLL